MPIKWSDRYLDKYESIFDGKMKIRKGYLPICIILGVTFFILLAIAGCAGLGLDFTELSQDEFVKDVWDFCLKTGIKIKYTIKW